MTTNYVSIKSVLYDLSLSINERYWNEAIATEWAAKAFRMMNLELALEPKVALLTVASHKTSLPADFKYLVQAARYMLELAEYNLEDETLPDLSTWQLTNALGNGWAPMRLSSNPYHLSICLDRSILNCTSCVSEFSISNSLVMTTNFEQGTVMLAYLAHPVDENGNMLIPDDEALKEALRNYVLFRYWETKALMMEDGAKQEREYYLNRWQITKMRAMNLNLPDVNTLENLKNQFNRLVPRENRFNQFFLTLSNRENVNF